MAAYEPLVPLRCPRRPAPDSAERRLWRRYRNVLLRQDLAGIVALCTSSTLYAVTCSSRVRLFDYSNQPQGCLSRFKTQALGGDFRPDGELLAAGDADGLVRVFQVKRKAELKSFKHKGAVHVVKFAADGQHVATGCDDGGFRVFDLSLKYPMFRQDAAHSDYIRCLQQLDEQVYVTGGLDAMVRLWDVRQQGSVQDLSHGAPLSAIVGISSNTLVTAGYVRMTFWDLRKSQEVSTFTPHSKNITCVSLDSTHTRLLTGSMDSSVKIHDLSTHEVLYSLKYPAQVTAAVLTHENMHLVVGMSDGKLSVRQRPGEVPNYRQGEEIEDGYVQELIASQKALASKEVIKDTKYFHRGANEKADESDLQLEKTIRTKLSEYDSLLKKFRYGEVLDCALRTQRPEIIVSVLQELEQRSALQTALRCRTPVRLTQAQICDILTWIESRIGSPKYAEVVLGVLSLVLEMYGAVAQVDPGCYDVLQRLTGRVDEEYFIERKCLETLGVAQAPPSS